MTMPLTHITIQADVLYSKLPSTVKLVLGAIKSFPDNGLMLSNEEIGKFAGVCPDRVTKILKNLRDKKLIKTVNPQSKYRRTYSDEKGGVESDLLRQKERSSRLKRQDTPSFSPGYSDEKDGHKLRKEENKNGGGSGLEGPAAVTKPGKFEIRGVDELLNLYLDRCPEAKHEVSIKPAHKRRLEDKIAKDIRRYGKEAVRATIISGNWPRSAAPAG
jgi:hypothetical protein